MGILSVNDTKNNNDESKRGREGGREVKGEKVRERQNEIKSE